MSDLINASICLSDIPKDKITTSPTNGKKYLNICIARRQAPDSFGNTHSMYVSQSQEERQAKTPKNYIGSGKEWSQTPQQSSAPVNPFAAGNPPVDDDLPF